MEMKRERKSMKDSKERRDGNWTVGHDDGGIKAGAMKQLTHTAGWIISTSVSPPAPISPLCATIELYGSSGVGGRIERNSLSFSN